MQGLQVKPIFGFSGINKAFGVISTEGKNPYNKKPVIFANSGKNFRISDSDLERPRSPQKIATTGETLKGKGLFGIECVINNTHFILVIFDGNIYNLSSSHNLTLLYTGLSNEYPVQYIIFNNKLILLNNINKPLEFDGSTVQEIDFIEDPVLTDLFANAYGASIHSNDLYYFDERNVYKPRPGTYNNFDNTLSSVDALPVNDGNNGSIMGMKEFQNGTAIIFTRYGISTLTGNQPYSDTTVSPHSLQQLTTEMGCVSRQSIVEANNDLFFLSDNGLYSLKSYALTKDIKTTNLFYGINQDFKELVKVGQFNKAFSVYDKNRSVIYFFVKTWGDKTICYSYNVISGEVERYEYDQDFTAAFYVNGKGIYLLDSEGGIYDFNAELYEDDFVYETHYEATKYGIGTIKKWNKLLLSVQTTTSLENLVIKTKHIKADELENWSDGEIRSINSGDVWDVAQWDVDQWDNEGSGIIRVKNLGKSKAIKILIENKTKGEHFRITRGELHYIPLGQVKG